MDVPSFDRVLKHDLRTGEVHEFALGEGRACGDIVFVPNRRLEKANQKERDDDEDDGHLLVLTHVLAEDRAELLVLGRDERTGGLARVATVRVPVRVPFGFHNEYVPARSSGRLVIVTLTSAKRALATFQSEEESADA